VQTENEISQGDVLRADVYRLMAVLLRAAPEQATLDMLASMRGDETPLGKAVAQMAMLASKTTGSSVDVEYHTLFIGVDGGEISPYGSNWIKDFMHENMLEHLRSDMERAGIGMRTSITEAEDHIAALCEMMAGMILGDFSHPVSLIEQRSFFKAHLSPWARTFFTQLSTARSSVFYVGVAGIGTAFIDIEEAAFEMV